jgi:hypothetical protein
MREPTAGDEIDANRQPPAGGIELRPPHLPRRGHAKGGLQKLLLAHVPSDNGPRLRSILAATHSKFKRGSSGEC